jgi:hypothetical protein
MNDIIAFEKKYGYIVAIVVTVISAVLIKYGYDDREEGPVIVGKVYPITMKGKIMIAAGVIMIVAAWGAALSYSN